MRWHYQDADWFDGLAAPGGGHRPRGVVIGQEAGNDQTILTQRLSSLIDAPCSKLASQPTSAKLGAHFQSIKASERQELPIERPGPEAYRSHANQPFIVRAFSDDGKCLLVGSTDNRGIGVDDKMGGELAVGVGDQVHNGSAIAWLCCSKDK